MDEKELMLEGARYAVAKQIEKGGSMFACRNKSEGSKWQTMDWVKIHDYLTELINRGGSDD